MSLLNKSLFTNWSLCLKLAMHGTTSCLKTLKSHLNDSDSSLTEGKFLDMQASAA